MFSQNLSLPLLQCEIKRKEILLSINYKKIEEKELFTNSLKLEFLKVSQFNFVLCVYTCIRF